MFRTIWVYLNMFLATVYVGTIVIGSNLLRLRRAEVFEWAPRAWSGWILWASDTPILVEGLEHLDPDRPQIIVANHQSWYDVWSLAVTIPRRYRFVAKKELERIPIFGASWKAAGHISIDRSDRGSAIRSLEEAGRQIQQDNSSVVIFPEGTRSRSGKLLPFKKGAFMLALHTRVPVLPVAISGTRRILPSGRWRVRPGPIIIRFGRPIPTAGYSESEREKLVADVRGRIEEMLHELPASRPET